MAVFVEEMTCVWLPYLPQRSVFWKLSPVQVLSEGRDSGGSAHGASRCERFQKHGILPVKNQAVELFLFLLCTKKHIFFS